jgi:hypothetical protein
MSVCPTAGSIRRLQRARRARIWPLILTLGCLWSQPLEPVAVAAFDSSKLRDITGIERSAAPPAGAAWRLVAAVVAVILAALALTTWGVRRLQSRERPPVSLERRAFEELDALERLKRSPGHTVQMYHTAISDIVRRYLQGRLEIPATQRTTEEFFETVRAGETLTPEQREILGLFLGRCDRVKFAPEEVPMSECESTRGLAERFIESESLPPSDHAKGRKAGPTPESEGLG